MQGFLKRGGVLPFMGYIVCAAGSGAVLNFFKVSFLPLLALRSRCGPNMGNTFCIS